jgi:hypothetical protein
MRLEDGFLHRFHERTSVYEIAGMKERSAMMRERGGKKKIQLVGFLLWFIYLLFFYILV